MGEVMAQEMIAASSLVKRFGEVTAVDKISFKVKKGEIFAFLGPNGAGKSTTIKMLTTLLQPTSGEITMDGFNVVHQQEQARKAFGIVFQDPSVDDELTAKENMWLHAVLYGVPRAEIDGRIEELLGLVELWDRRNSRVKTFSGGMKRRLEIARGLLHHPTILFLDEPTLGLDTQTRNLLWNYVKSLNKSQTMTIFFTTHYLEEAENIADNIAIIDHGKIIATGTASALMKQTKTKSLEAAYLKLTGKELRDEAASGTERLKLRYRARGGGFR
jgi:ABC-2 type transport system ATP-binding protein